MMTDLLLIIDTDNIHTILRQLYDTGYGSRWHGQSQ